MSFRARSETVLVNLNFTFGVLADERKSRLDSVSDAVRQVGARAVVSVHPAERTQPADSQSARGYFGTTSETPECL